MSKNPKVSIIIPTKNSQSTLENCLKSCIQQTYKNTEIIVIDNFSTDQTSQICKKFPQIIFETSGPERNLQRPRGAEIATGDWLVFIDSDMELSPFMIADSVKKSQENPEIKAFILPEVSEGKGFWSRCKILERTCYLHYKPMEWIRMMDRKAYDSVGGWDKSLIAGEDHDIYRKFLEKNYQIGRSNEFIIHHEGEIKFWQYLQKKYYYGKFLKKYFQKVHREKIKQQNNNSPLHKGKLGGIPQKPEPLWRKLFIFRTCYYKHGKYIFTHPLLYIGMFFFVGMTQIVYFIGMIRGEK